MPSFIETQFPIARLSAESYKERKAAVSQTLPTLGKWWGRKPLILVRSAILGMLMPASGNPKKDRDIFLKVLTMDDDGVWQRCGGDIPAAAWREAASPELREAFFGKRGFHHGVSDNEKLRVCSQIWNTLDRERRQALDNLRPRPTSSRREFDLLSYSERIRHCTRPENHDGPTEEVWVEINEHLGTKAFSLRDLVQQLGERIYSHAPRVGDCFCGGGSIPFEAARIGCQAFGSDLNPVAGLLSWSDLNILGKGEAVKETVREMQRRVFEQADEIFTNWGIEHGENNERGDAYLYCSEVKPSGCDYYIPLAPSWVVSEKYRIVVKWSRMDMSDRLTPHVIEVSPAEFAEYMGTSDGAQKKGATAIDGRVLDPLDATRSWAIESLRGPDGLRRWTTDDIIPRPDDVFQERLYCIRWTDENGTRRYAAPTDRDLVMESKALTLLHERYALWKLRGYIPSKAIPAGYNTDQPLRERGWTHWHHMFAPRQLLAVGLLAELFAARSGDDETAVAGGLLAVGSASDFNSKLCRWIPNLAASGGIGAFAQTFYNQALNTLYNWGVRGLLNVRSTLCAIPTQNTEVCKLQHSVSIADAREIAVSCDLWITDPPYADAVNYHELGDFYLAWYEKRLQPIFPRAVIDSRGEMAVRGDGQDFRRSMVEIYGNLASHMPDNGMQMVMFTHQDPSVWADLGMILWAAGLKATAAWTISTETEAAGIKKGSYVQGTVCLVLRKRSAFEAGFLDEIFPLVEDEVKRQIDSMQALDEGGEPNFNDADYQLAAYAAALKVLTQYGAIDGRDVEHEVFAVRERGQKSDFQNVIERALGIACDYLIPRGLDIPWRDLTLVERYYLRALDIESRGERRKGMYEELARGFGVADIRPLLKADKANGATMHTPSGLGAGLLTSPAGAVPAPDRTLSRRGRAVANAPHPFASSSLRHLLFAIRETAAGDNDPELGRQYLRDTYGPGVYWQLRERFLHLLEWLAGLGNSAEMTAWSADSAAARLLAGRLRNDEA